MKPDDLAALKSLPIFKDIKAQTFSRACTPSFLQTFPQGTKLLEESQPADFLYIILDGLVEMFSDHHGRDIVIEVLEPANLFILAAVLNDDVCLQSARCLTASRLLMIPATVVRSLMSEDAVFMKAIVFELACAYRRTLKALKNQKARSAAERLANWLLIESAKPGNGNVFELRIEKKVLALWLGMTPENLSRSFLTLKDHGLSADNYQIQIRDIDALRRFAGPSSLIDNS
jgi:CRP/FNR family transcriptional activator FtrB